MEILTIIIILIVVWFIFKIVIPAFKMTYGNMDVIGESSKYVDANHPIVKNTVAMSRLQYVIKKYRKKILQTKGPHPSLYGFGRLQHCSF